MAIINRPPYHNREEQRSISRNIMSGWLLILVLIITVYLIINSSYFNVGEIVIRGNKYIAQEEVYRVAGIPDTINIFRLDTAEIKKRLTQDLRVSEVEVVRKLPATIAISIKERQPLAYIANMYGFAQLDKQGVVLAVFKSIKQINVPIITGIRLGNAYVGDKADSEYPLLKNVLSYLSLLDENTLNQLSEIHVSSTNDLTAYTLNHIQVRVGNTERLNEKAKMTCDILQEIHTKKIAIEYIDLNYASPYIKFRQ